MDDDELDVVVEVQTLLNVLVISQHRVTDNIYHALAAAATATSTSLPSKSNPHLTAVRGVATSK